MSKAKGYLVDSRHPWPCFLFVMPLLLLYEGAVLALGGAAGFDAQRRRSLAAGFSQGAGAEAPGKLATTLAGILFWRRRCCWSSSS